MTIATDDAPPTTSKLNEDRASGLSALTRLNGDNLIGRSVTINRPRVELFAYWRDFSNLPSFMDNVERIDILSSTASHWVVKAPAGRTVEWDATITEEKTGELIAWTSAANADVPNSGRIEFRDAGARGTIVTATIAYDPPSGLMGKVIAKLFQREPGIQARRDLRCFKQLMETGEVATAAWTQKQRDEEKA